MIIKKSGLLVMIALLFCCASFATDYYTKSSDCVLYGNNQQSVYITTNPDGVTGLSSYLITASDNLYCLSGATVGLVENTTINSITVISGTVLLQSSYDKTLIVSGTVQLGGRLILAPPMEKTVTLQLGNGGTGTGAIMAYNGATFDGLSVCLDASLPRAALVITGGALAGNYTIPKNSFKNSEVNNIEINLANISNYVGAAYNSASNYIRIKGQLKLTRGRLLSQLPTSVFSGSFTLTENATISGGYFNSSTDFSFIAGSVTVLTNNTATKTLPTGFYIPSSTVDFKPAYITPQTSDQGEYYVAYYQDAEESSSCNINHLTNYASADYWEIRKTTNSPAIKVGITYSNTVGNNYWRNAVGPTSSHVIVLAHKQGCWQDETGNILASTATNGILSSGAYLTSLSPFRAAFGPVAVLPLRLVSFTGEHYKDKNALYWQTADELNVNGFEIQAATNIQNFSTIAIVKANNNTSNNYNYFDVVSTGQTIYYRLKIIETTGSYSYSNIVKLAGVQPALTVSIWPNPVTNNKINIKSKPGTLSILTLTGKKIRSDNITIEGVNSVNLSNLPNGIYICKWVGIDGETSVKKIIKQ